MEERSGEKHQLNELNDRLEYYVEYQKEKRRDYQRMKEALEQAEVEFDQKMKAKDAAHARELKQWESERTALRMDLAQQREDAKRYKTERDELDSRNFRLEKSNKELETKTTHLENALASTQGALEETRNQLQKKGRALEKAEAECSQLDAANRALKGENAVLGQENGQLRDKWGTTNEALEREKAARAKDVNTLRAELRERELAQKRLEKEMREEFERKLRKWIEERKRQYAQEKAEWMQIFQDEYNRKLKNLKDANDAKQKQIGQLIADKNDLNDKILDLNTRISGLERERARLENDISQWRTSFDDASAEIRDLKAVIARKAQEYQELLAAHVPLLDQITRYRAVLAEEEDMTGFTGQVSKKRKFSQTGMKEEA